MLLFGLAPCDAHAWSDDIFAAFLQQGGWHENAEDNIQGETLSAELVQRIVTKYRAQPEDRDAQQDLGLLALAMGVAEWGIADPAGLPRDPRDKNWASDTGIDSGKHLMSYAVGGIGISHADVGDLERFIRQVAESDLVPMPHRPGLLRLANRDLYKPRNGRRNVIYDEIRAAGVCAPNPSNTDRNDLPFKHFNGPAGSVYCAKHRNRNLTEQDWRVLRTWMRAALRTKPMQERLASLWMEKYWTPSLHKVPPGPGFVEEVLVNVRIRNSTPATADRAPNRRPANTVAERVQRELDAYGQFSAGTLKRRCRIMLRPVGLYRHFAGEPPLQGVQCPPGAD
jgi:hypothetical protein